MPGVGPVSPIEEGREEKGKNKAAPFCARLPLGARRGHEDKAMLGSRRCWSFVIAHCRRAQQTIRTHSLCCQDPSGRGYESLRTERSRSGVKDNRRARDRWQRTCTQLIFSASVNGLIYDQLYLRCTLDPGSPEMVQGSRIGFRRSSPCPIYLLAEPTRRRPCVCSPSIITSLPCSLLPT